MSLFDAMRLDARQLVPRKAAVEMVQGSWGKEREVRRSEVDRGGVSASYVWL